MDRLRALWLKLTPAERGKIRQGAIALASALVWVARGRLVALLAAGGIAAVTTASLVDVAPAPVQPTEIRYAWVGKAGPFKVQRLAGIPCSSVSVDARVAPKGVGHTIEGSLESGLSVFRRHYAPHFVVGRDRGGVVRIYQLCPLGKLGLALANRAGGVETNRWARVQIELAAFSKRSAWEPDAGVMRAYGALLWRLRYVAGIPLRHVPNPARDPRTWSSQAGWFDHAGVPENDHWDMGAFRWSKAIAIANSFAKVVSPGHVEPARPAAPAVSPRVAIDRAYGALTPIRTQPEARAARRHLIAAKAALAR